MSKLLYIESSPRKNRSASIEVADKFLHEYQKNHQTDEIEKIDLWSTDLPEFSNDVIEAKYAIMHQHSQTEAERKAWRRVEQLIAQFKQADKYVISIPMWNFTIPYKLKHYIDLIVQPSYTFTYSPEDGYKGLVTGKPIVLICARGGSYAEGSGAEKLDMQVPYMELILGFIGFKDVKKILIDSTLGGEESKKIAVEKAVGEAEELAKKF